MTIETPIPRNDTAPGPAQDPLCPDCGTAVDLDPGVLEHEILVCDGCGVELEVVALDPPRLDLAPEVEEDWGE